jgi:hypothetical protein
VLAAQVYVVAPATEQGAHASPQNLVPPGHELPHEIPSQVAAPVDAPGQGVQDEPQPMTLWFERHWPEQRW